ncbi:MAG: AsnC family transcriptional regulator [Gammaproteobacteria bacterium]|jgi:DNA-binding Lrp family transcriptional regulator
MDMNVTPHPALHDPVNRALLQAIEGGLPLAPRPYARVGEQLGISESQVMRRLQELREQGIIKRLGVVVRHRLLGYRANAMVVWDIPDDQVRTAGRCLGSVPFVTLCYRRPRRLPDWPYNLFTMIHGRDRAQVLERVDHLLHTCGMQDVAHRVLFSQRCFKQRGARYTSLSSRAEVAP